MLIAHCWLDLKISFPKACRAFQDPKTPGSVDVLQIILFCSSRWPLPKLKKKISDKRFLAVSFLSQGNFPASAEVRNLNPLLATAISPGVNDRNKNQKILLYNHLETSALSSSFQLTTVFKEIYKKRAKFRAISNSLCNRKKTLKYLTIRNMYICHNFSCWWTFVMTLAMGAQAWTLEFCLTISNFCAGCL